jgi:hypothetical protein
MPVITITLDDGEQDFILGIAGQGETGKITPDTALSIAAKVREARSLVSQEDIYAAGRELGIPTASLEIRLSAQSPGPYTKEQVLRAAPSREDAKTLLGHIEDKRS